MLDIPSIIQIAAVTACVAVATKITCKNIRDWRGDRFLCDTCKFNSDELCEKEQRPEAIECSAYQPQASIE